MTQRQGIQLIAGLGNPGRAYAATRHNVGFLVLERLSAAYGLALEQKKFKNRYQRGRIEGKEVILAAPQAYMNLSGPPLVQLARYFRVATHEILVVHDDIDLQFGRLQIKEKGGDGGHKGIRSIIEAFGAGDFIRLRVGIGRSESGVSVSDHVLSRFDPAEEDLLAQILDRARDAVVTVICQGLKAGMNQFNDRRSQISG